MLLLVVCSCCINSDYVEHTAKWAIFGRPLGENFHAKRDSMKICILVWLSGSVTFSENKVSLRQAWLQLG